MINMQGTIFLILTTCFFWRIIANFDKNVFVIARTKLCKIGRAPYGVRLISYNADRAPSDVFIYRRRTAPVRYVTTQEKILKNRPVPGRLSNSSVMCTALKSYVSFICDHSISVCSTLLWPLKCLVRFCLFEVMFFKYLIYSRKCIYYTRVLCLWCYFIFICLLYLLITSKQPTPWQTQQFLTIICDWVTHDPHWKTILNIIYIRYMTRWCCSADGAVLDSSCRERGGVGSVLGSDNNILLEF